MRKQSIQDIARKLKISATTVSMVLNGKAGQYKISKKTQDRINEYIAKIKYIPNANARGLSSGKSYIIGYLVPDISNPFFARVSRKIEDILANEGYQLMSSSFDENPKKESNIINILLARQVDGLIVAPSEKSKNVLKQVIDAGIPLVTFDRDIPGIDTDFVGIKNKESAFNALSELIKKGHRKIAMVTLTPDVITIKERIEGYYQALTESGIEIDQSLIIHADFKDLKNSISKKLTDVFNLHPDLKTIFFINNLCTFNGLLVINNFFSSKMKELTLLSFDDIEFFEFSRPYVSGIAQPRDLIAENCAQLLLNKINNPKDDPKKIFLNTKINWR